MATPVTTPRGMALQNLSKQLPVANQRIAQGQQAARDMQLQQAVAAAPAPSSNVQQTAAQTGASAAASKGAELVENAQKGIQQGAQIAQVGLQEQTRVGQEKLTGLEMGARDASMQNAQRLAALDNRAKQEIYDKQMQFQRDEMGRTLFNDRQLLDYARTKAGSDEEFANYAQQMKQATDRNLQAMRTAYANVNEDLDQKMQIAEQQKDQKAARQIAETKRAMEEEMQRQENETANKNSMFAAVGTIGGAVVGGFLGAGAGGIGAAPGAAIGASVGGAVGTGVASTTNKPAKRG